VNVDRTLSKLPAFLTNTSLFFVRYSQSCVMLPVNRKLPVYQLLALYFAATKAKAKYPLASSLSHSLQLCERALNSVPMVLSRQRAYTPALQLGVLNDMSGRPHLSPCLLPFASVTHSPDGATTVCSNSSQMIAAYYSFIDPERMKG